MKLNEIKHVLASERIRLTKSLGQNFLHDANQVRRILAAADLAASDRVLEIGPGLGQITEPLLGATAHVLAIEKDARLFAFLQQRWPAVRNLTLLCDDALGHLERQPHDWSDWKLVANLPYSVASPILVALAQARRPPERLVTTVQLEVAHRILSSCGRKEYGVLTLLIQLTYQPAKSFPVPAGCFFPKPTIDSACVTLIRRSHPLLAAAQMPIFLRLVKRAFSQRRKMMLKLLKQDWPEDTLHAAFQQAGLPRETRADQVSLEQFVQLTRSVCPAGTPISQSQPEPQSEERDGRAVELGGTRSCKSLIQVDQKRV